MFREELTYRREVRLGDTVQITSHLVKLNEDATRWSIAQEILRPDGQLAAAVHCDGAWIDLAMRKLAAPPAEVVEHLGNLISTDH